MILVIRISTVSVITVEDPDLDIYIIDGINEREIVRELRHLDRKELHSAEMGFSATSSAGGAI